MLLSDLAVTAQAPVLVPPSQPTPCKVLYLSNLDDQLFLRFTIKYIFVYRSRNRQQAQAQAQAQEEERNDRNRQQVQEEELNDRNRQQAQEEEINDTIEDDPVEAMRSALSKVLVSYYPLAGRLRRSGGDLQNKSNGKLEVVCNGEGAVFVEASADLTIDEFHRVQKPCKTWKKLLYKVDADNFVGIPPLVVQVTRLKCGGFVFCVGFSHCLCDGLGSSQFLHAWAEMARGGTGVSVRPVWGRHLLRPKCPPRVEYSHPEFKQVQDFCNFKERLRADAIVSSSVCFTSAQLQELKKTVISRDSACKCTSFEVLSAHVWRCWIRAMDLPGVQAIKLLFSVNVRKRLQPQLPPGFFGNGFVLACAETTVKELSESSLSYAVKLVQKAKASLTNEYIRSLINYLDDKSARPDLVATLVISQWSRLDLTEVDFGWGKPLHVGPLGSDIYCLFLPFDGQLDAVNVLLSVPRAIIDKYEFYMRNISDFRPSGRVEE